MTTANPFENRREILFLYEARDCNPNGDPLDENRPRTDPETGVCTVTDVRIKRTIRDEILAREPDEARRLAAGTEILIRDTHKDNGFLSEGKDRADHFASAEVKKLKGGAKAQALQEAVLKQCIDARLFGTTLPVDKGSLKVTGPVQFLAFNRSLHAVTPQLVQQTAAFAGGSSAHQKSFAERYLLPYALIAAYGVANEVAARTSRATDADLDLMADALWNGTASLATTSKMGHAPLLMVQVVYTPGRQLGMLQERIHLRTDLEDVRIRSTADYLVDVSELARSLAALGPDVVGQVRVHQDQRLRTCDAVGTVREAADILRTAGLPVEQRL